MMTEKAPFSNATTTTSTTRVQDHEIRLGLNTLQWLIGEWNGRTFGIDRVLPLAAHLRREARELHESIVDGEFGSPISIEHVAEECADILHFLCAIAHQLGFSLADATLTKFAVNQGRQWQKPDADGCIEHVKS